MYSSKLVKLQAYDDNNGIPCYKFDYCIIFREHGSLEYKPLKKISEKLIGKSMQLQVKVYSFLLFSISDNFYIQTDYTILLLVLVT